MRNFANPALNSILDRPNFQGSFVRSTGGPGAANFANNQSGAESGISQVSADISIPGASLTGRVSTAFLGAAIVGLVAFNYVTRKVQL